MKASRHTILYDYRNKLAPWFGYLMQIWIWSELLTLFLNPKRQSFQDRIASTVVVHVPEPAEESQDDAQQVEYEQGPQLIQKPESDVKHLSLPNF